MTHTSHTVYLVKKGAFVLGTRYATEKEATERASTLAGAEVIPFTLPEPQAAAA